MKIPHAITMATVVLLLSSCATTEEAPSQQSSTDEAQAQSGELEQSREVTMAYIQTVLNPTMDEVGNSVVLENEEYRITMKPDLAFEWVDKASSTTSVGRRGFVTDVSFSKATSYLLFLDSLDQMSSEEFLEESNYREESDIAVEPMRVANDTVTYRVVRPTQAAGDLYTFSVTVIE